jgi:hypothetical protein
VSTWHDLVTASLIGTERTVVPPVAIPGLPPVADHSGDPAAILLDRAALLTVARRAGRRPNHADPLPVAEPDPRPVVNPAAGHRLARILAGEYPKLLAEWLTAAAARGLRPPPQLLPALLDLARGEWPHEQVLPSLVTAAGGPRARWLAGLNPDWKFAAAAPQTVPIGEDAWRFGKILERRGYLASLLARDPAAARELIASTWAAHPGERYMYLMVLSDGLSAADEPLLEAALDDPDPQVRRSASLDLAGLPESAYAGRMAERAARCVVIERHAGSERLVAHPPAECDAAMQRDGIEPYLRPDIWIFELVARAPLRTWTDTFGRTPAQIVGMPTEGGAQMLVVGWTRAAIRQRNQAWASALIHRVIAGLPRPISDLTGLARHADPALGAPGALAEPAADAPPAVRDMVNVLRFRYEMHKELGDDHGNG